MKRKVSPKTSKSYQHKLGKPVTIRPIEYDGLQRAYDRAV
jgi:hypothetical protein